MNPIRFLASCLIFSAGLAGAASKGTVEPVNKDRDGIAIKGYDSVAYFQQNKPVRGSMDYVHEWMGATWHFSSAGNRDRFAADPAHYAPQYGGYCAWAVGHGYTAEGDPEAWKVVNGKLYLNYSKSVLRQWETDPKTWIMKGDSNWPTLHN
jgi:YHS domain-containing protein